MPINTSPTITRSLLENGNNLYSIESKGSGDNVKALIEFVTDKNTNKIVAYFDASQNTDLSLKATYIRGKGNIFGLLHDGEFLEIDYKNPESIPLSDPHELKAANLFLERFPAGKARVFEGDGFRLHYMSDGGEVDQKSAYVEKLPGCKFDVSIDAVNETAFNRESPDRDSSVSFFVRDSSNPSQMTVITAGDNEDNMWSSGVFKTAEVESYLAHGLLPNSFPNPTTFDRSTPTVEESSGEFASNLYEIMPGVDFHGLEMVDAAIQAKLAATLSTTGAISFLAVHSNSQANKRQEGFDAVMNFFDASRNMKYDSWKGKIKDTEEAISHEDVELSNLTDTAVQNSIDPEKNSTKEIELLRLAKQKFSGSRRGLVGNDFANNFARAFEYYCTINEIKDDEKKDFATAIESFVNAHEMELKNPSMVPAYDPVLSVKAAAINAVGLAQSVYAKVAGKHVDPMSFNPVRDSVETMSTKKGLDEQDLRVMRYHLGQAQAGAVSLAADASGTSSAESLYAGLFGTQPQVHAQKARDYGKNLSVAQSLAHKAKGFAIDVFKPGHFLDNIEHLGRCTQAGRDARKEMALDDMQKLIANCAVQFDAGTKEKFTKEETDLLKEIHQKLSQSGEGSKDAQYRSFNQFFAIELKKVLCAMATTATEAWTTREGEGSQIPTSQSVDCNKVVQGFQNCFKAAEAELQRTVTGFGAIKQLRNPLQRMKDLKSFSSESVKYLSGLRLESDFSPNDSTFSKLVVQEVDLMCQQSKDYNNTLVRLAKEQSLEVELATDGLKNQTQKNISHERASTSKARVTKLTDDARARSEAGSNILPR